MSELNEGSLQVPLIISEALYIKVPCPYVIQQ